jgi:hypothetical protein
LPPRTRKRLERNARQQATGYGAKSGVKSTDSESKTYVVIYSHPDHPERSPLQREALSRVDVERLRANVRDEPQPVGLRPFAAPRVTALDPQTELSPAHSLKADEHPPQSGPERLDVLARALPDLAQDRGPDRGQLAQRGRQADRLCLSDLAQRDKASSTISRLSVSSEPPRIASSLRTD